MKTYTKTTQAPRLVINYDSNAQSPREWDNLGYFITVERNHTSPDNDKILIAIIDEASEEANNTDEHIALIKRRIESDTDDKVIIIYPVYRYEHGNVTYKRGKASGFDYSNCGFYIVTEKSMAKLGEIIRLNLIEKYIDGELATYTQWCNGEVYSWTLYNEQDEVEDGGGDYYSLEDIKAELPKEWEGEKLEDYISNN